MNIVQRIIPKGRHNRPGVRRTPKYVIMHNTANPGATALGHARYLETTPETKSWHFTVDDVNVVQHLPLEESGYHAADGKYGPGNLYGIGVEVCEFEDAKRQAAADEKAAELVAWLLRKYGWGIDKVRTHREFSPSRKNCPRKLLPKWDQFLKAVQKHMGNANTTPHPILRFGSRGPAVKRLQEALLELGYKLPRYGADGAFGRETDAAVRQFQKDHRLVVDGVVGPKTWTALETAIAKKRAPKPAPKPAPAKEPDTLELVIAGAFTPGTGNAQKHAKRLEADGYDAWTITVPRNWVDILKGAGGK